MKLSGTALLLAGCFLGPTVSAAAEEEMQAVPTVATPRVLQQLNCPTPPPPPTPYPTPQPNWNPPPIFWGAPSCGCPDPTDFLNCHPCRRQLRSSEEIVREGDSNKIDVIPIRPPADDEPAAPTIPLSKPCLLFRVEIMRGNGVPSSEWQCEIDEDDAGDEDALIDLPSNIYLFDPEDEMLVSGSTTLYIPQTSINLDEGTMLAPPNALQLMRLGSIDPTYRERRRLDVTGEKEVLVVRCSTNSGSPTDSRSIISDRVFGTLGDTVTLKSRLEACSYNQVCIKPASGQHIWNGVVEVTWNKNSNGEKTKKVKRKCLKEAKKKLGYRLKNNFDHVMLVLPSGTEYDDSANWAAFATVKGYQSTYNDVVIRGLNAQMHEIGHNFGLKHSGEDEDCGVSDEYCDFVGSMSAGLGSSNAPIKCYNGPHSWHLGWYDNRHLTVDSDSSTIPRTVTLTGIDSWTSGSGTPIILRVRDDCGIFQGKSYYIMYNRAVGINSGTGEAANQITVVWSDKTNPRKQSWLRAKLGASDPPFDMEFDGCSDDVRIQVLSISGATASIRLTHV